MKLAILSDIHGNCYALEKVLIEARKQEVDKLLILGDFVGYYYHPDKVLDLLSNWPIEAIKGNHELILQQLNSNEIDSHLIKQKYGSGHELALAKLSNDDQEWLFALPEQKSLVIDNVSIQMNHGSPWSSNQYLYPDSDRKILEQCDSPEHNFVFIGHSHYSFSFRCNNSTLINCGSVGQSREKGGVANWILMNTLNGCFQIKSTVYDVSPLLEEIIKLDQNTDYSYKILLR